MLLPVAVVLVVNTLFAQQATEVNQKIQMENALESFSTSRSYFITNGFGAPGNTVGTPYLYAGWSNMWLDSMDNKPVKHSVTYPANFDLDKNMLIIKSGDNKAFAPETQHVQAFHFQQGDTIQYFVRVKMEDANKFLQRLAAGKYTLVKDAKVLFMRANYEDKGMVQTGKKYDEYKKEYTYYLVKDGVPVKISLKKKSFISALGNDSKALAAAKKFLETYNGAFDEAAAIEITEALNQ
ncbi:hypothetical protein CLV51_102494 [Chitinophaga niastensis]|uniref:Uncharacterized protein n=2 Tax=Chitinophaga niastensis TaxID=536980 RepID=A0A2P8HN66_CHINA|nr:hypothetical protein CLV51_102494 [Chitinophaga niastensis]